MGVAATRSAPTKAPAAPALVAARPRVLQVRQSSQLLQRACDCGATSGLSGRCASCDRVGLERARDSGPAPALHVVAPAAGEARPGFDFSRVGIRAGQGIGAAVGAASLQPQPKVRVSAPVRMQAQLRVSSPSDAAEQEAQAIGKLFARVPEPAVAAGRIAPLSVSASGDPHAIHRRDTGPAVITAEIEERLQKGKSGGEGLPQRWLNFLELRFAANFGAVRFHVDDNAAALCEKLDARAVTIGHDVYFGKGQFRPDTHEGWELIGHELTHTIQQGSVKQATTPAAKVAAPTPQPASPAAVAKPVAVAKPAAAAAPVDRGRAIRPTLPSLAAPVTAPALAPVRMAAPVAALAVPAHEPAAARVTASTPAPVRTAVPAAAPASARVAERAPRSVQRGLWDTIVAVASDPLGFIADKATLIPGWRMLTIVLGVNPVTMAKVDRSPANILMAMVEFMPGGILVTKALQNSGVFDKVGNWIADQIKTLVQTGAELKAAVTRFIAERSWSDIGDLGGVWESAKRIFTEPIEKLKAFAKRVVTDVLKFIKDAILLPLAKLAEGTPSWDLLTAVIGTNPITGATVQRTPEKLIGGFLKLIHQDEVWDNMERSKAIPRAWAWFQGAMQAVIAFVSQIPEKFSTLFTSLTIEDVVLVVGAFEKVKSVFGGFVANFISWAGTALWNLLEIIFDVVSPGALAYVKKTGNALKAILKDPLPFVRNLVAAAKLGFQQFADNFGSHLKQGLIDWLTGSLPGVYIPKAFSLIEFGKFALSVLGITWAQIRAKIVKALGQNGETIMKALETAFDIVVALIKGGIGAVWELIKEKLTNLKDMVIDGIVGFVTDTVIKKAIPKLISMFIPGAGFISAIVSIYDTIKVFIEKLAKMIAVVKSFVDSIVAIAAGEISSAASRVEGALAGLISLAISFLAGFLGLGDIADKVMAVVKKVQETVDKALDTAINWIIGKAKALFASLFGKGGKPDDRTPAQKQADLEKGVAEADALLADPKLTSVDVAKRLPAIKAKYKMTELAIVTDAKAEGSETDHIHGAINPDKNSPQHQKTAEDKQTNIHIVRSTFTVSTKWQIAQDFPEQHQALVTGQARPPRLNPQLDRRHVISSQSMAAHYESVLNATKWSKAKDILTHARGQPETVADPLGDPTIQAAAQSRHKRFFNDAENLFVGDASENRSIGAEKDIPKDWTHDEWLAHLDYIKANYALDDSFTP